MKPDQRASRPDSARALPWTRAEPVPAVPAALRGTSAWWPCATATTARRPPGPPAAPDCRKTESCVTDLAFPRSNPQMIQSSTMRTLRAIPLLPALAGAAGRGQRPPPPPVQPATSFAAVEVHDDEKVAIAAEPYDTREKESIFRVDYLSHGVHARPAHRDQQRRPAHLTARCADSLHDRGRRQDSGRRARGRGAADDPKGARRRKTPHARLLCPTSN